MRILITIVLAVIGANAYAASDYYVWVDEDGVTNYSERPPGENSARNPSSAGQPAESDDSEFNRRRPGAVEPPPEQSDEDTEQASASTAPSSSPDESDEDDADPADLIAEERAQIQAEIDKTKKANCEVGKRNLAQLEAYSRIRVKDDSGEERFLSEEERQAQIDEARQIVRDNCTG